MSTKTFTKACVRAAVFGDAYESSPLVLVEAGPWIDEGKYQRQENIVRDTATGKTYIYLLSKSGSYFIDLTYSFEWDFDNLTLKEVFKTTKTIEVWEIVKEPIDKSPG